MQAVTLPGFEADIRACWDWLHGQPRTRPGAVACIGYCMGGRTAFFANTLLPFKAAVSYFGVASFPNCSRARPPSRGRCSCSGAPWTATFRRSRSPP